MLVVRPVREDDSHHLYELIQQSEYGLTTLKISHEQLQQRIEQSLFAFRQQTARPQGQPYVFVMEDLTNGRLVGTSAIYSKVGGYEPFYSYEIRSEIKQSTSLGVYKEIPYLCLKAEHDGPTEIGSLFLSPDYWGSGYGRLLSLSRFLFMAQFPERFERETIAEMRGIVNENGHSPLWDNLGAHFFQIEFPRAETLTAESKKFIAELMPKHPIYIPLLAAEAQHVIGKVHPNTEPAVAMLKKEGFANRNNVDIFDGGPELVCATKEIRAVRDSREATVAEIREEVEGESLLVANARLNFRATLGDVQWLGEREAAIDEVTALRLDLKMGDKMRAVLPRPPKTGSSERAASKPEALL